MKKCAYILTAVLIAASASAQVKASYFPAGTKLLVNIDVKQLFSSKTGELITGSMDEEAQRKLDSFKALSGIDIKTDLDSIYVAGNGEGQNSGVMYATGRFDINRLTAILGGNDGFKSEPYGSNKILTWVDKGQTNFASFVNNGLVLASKNTDQLKKALSLTEGKGEALASTSPFAKIIAARDNRLVSLAACDVNKLSEASPQMQMIKQAESIFFSIDQESSDKADIILNAAISAISLETAQQMTAMIQGFQAMMMMQAAQNPDVAQLAQNFKVDSKDTHIKMSLKLTEDQIKKQIADGIKKRQAMNADPAGAPEPTEVK